MQKKNYCYHCGSSTFRADRALAGRLICANCSAPLDTRNSKFRIIKTNRRSKIGFYLLIIVFIFLIIVFA